MKRQAEYIMFYGSGKWKLRQSFFNLCSFQFELGLEPELASLASVLEQDTEPIIIAPSVPAGWSLAWFPWVYVLHNDPQSTLDEGAIK